jgi:hypothetical protein
MVKGGGKEHSHFQNCDVFTFVHACLPSKRVYKNKHKFVQKDAKVEVLDIIMSLIVQSCAELGEKS